MQKRKQHLQVNEYSQYTCARILNFFYVLSIKQCD